MHKIGLKCAISATLVGMVFGAFAVTNQAELTLTALSDPSLALSKGEVRFIQYKLTNHSDKAYQLTMKPMPGIIQKTNSNDSCGASNKPLQPGKSCILSLKVNANEAIGLDKAGPRLCENTWNWYDEEGLATGVCIQPKEEEKISVHELSPNQASFSVTVKLPQKKMKTEFVDESLKRCFASMAGCTLVLFQTPPSDVVGDLIITNNSTSMTITNLRAYNVPAGVTQDYSNCVSIAPGQTCDLVFTPGSIRTLGQSVTVYGDNTSASTLTFQVLGIGDPYNDGNQLFQLPVTSDYNYYTAPANDIPGGPINWSTADVTCSGTYELPAIGPLSNLYAASNCAGGPIMNFSCSSLYWSATETGGGNADVINFSNGAQSSLAESSTAQARCVEGYVLVPLP